MTEKPRRKPAKAKPVPPTISEPAAPEDEDWELSKAQIREIERRVHDMDDPRRFVLASEILPSFVLYYDVSNNSATWSVRASSTSTVALSSVDLNPEQGNRYTFVALPGTAAGTLELIAIDDPYDKGLTTDRARVRALHAAPAAPAVDVYLIQPAQDLAVATPTYTALGYKAAMPASGDDSTEVPGGTFRLVLTGAGTKTIVFDAPVSIANNADWLLVAIPGPSGAANDVRVLVAQGNDDQNGTTVELVSQ